MRKVLLLLIALGIAIQFYYYANLPDRVAIHYSLGGMPDNWATKEWNLGFRLILIFFLNGIILFIPSLFKLIPKEAFNIPNKKYWLSSENFDQFVKRVTHWLDGLLVILNVFLIIVLHLDYNANMGETVELNEPLLIIALVIYVLASIYWAWAFYKDFASFKRS